MLPSLKVQDDFRLVRILPGMHGEPVRCELQTFSLDSAPPYEALSYRWTTEAADNTIVVNETKFHVRPNLYDFLSVVRDEGLTGWLFMYVAC